MPYRYRWARGEAKAQELAEKVSGCSDWRRIENTAKVGDVTCHKYEYQLEGDKYYEQYWLCYQYTDQWPADPRAIDTTIGFCTDGALDRLPKQRLQNGLEKIYR